MPTRAPEIEGIEFDDAPEALAKGVHIENVTDDLDLIIQKLPNGAVKIALLDFKQRYRETVYTPAIDTVYHNHLMAYFDADLVGLCCDDVLHVPGLNTVPHRNIKLIPALRGTGISASMYELSNRVGGVLDHEIAIRIDHCKMLIAKGFVPVSLHFTPRPELGDNGPVEKFNLDPEAARKLITLLKSFNRETDFTDAKLRFITQFSHQGFLEGGKFMDRFENVSLMSEFNLEAMARVLIDWDLVIFQAEKRAPEEVIASIRKYIDRFKDLLEH
ncbi:hypothetical protein GW756_03610 [bacterium]|nr:hypothetical protein [bacterium]NCQ55394.1 hypothetical protein [Candidatus Parcubacteria bacterium]NCS67756.1 hypothetical protein [Candidatus Peregrinibacteria bacterium]NCS96430.1 hypothetical protein [bacterium]